MFKGSFPRQMLGTHRHSPSGPSGKPAGTHLRSDPLTCVRRAGQSYRGPPDFQSGCRCPCVGSLRDLGARPPPGETGSSTPGGTGLFCGHIWLGAPGPASLLLALSPSLSPEKTPPGVRTWGGLHGRFKGQKAADQPEKGKACPPMCADPRGDPGHGRCGDTDTGVAEMYWGGGRTWE